MSRPCFMDRDTVRTPKTFTVSKINQQKLKTVSFILGQSESETINQLIENHARDIRTRNTESDNISTKSGQ